MRQHVVHWYAIGFAELYCTLPDFSPIQCTSCTHCKALVYCLTCCIRGKEQLDFSLVRTTVDYWPLVGSPGTFYPTLHQAPLDVHLAYLFFHSRAHCTNAFLQAWDKSTRVWVWVCATCTCVIGIWWQLYARFNDCSTSTCDLCVSKIMRWWFAFDLFHNYLYSWKRCHSKHTNWWTDHQHTIG